MHIFSVKQGNFKIVMQINNARNNSYISNNVGEGGHCFHFLIKSILFFVAWILFYFSISYKILPCNVYYYCILIRLSYAIRTFFCACFTSFHTHASLPTFFVCFVILFNSCCSHAQVFGKMLVNEFSIPIPILNGNIFFHETR